MRTKNLFGETTIKDFIVPSIPYMGGKRKLATKILNSIYKTVGDFENFYDLFGGGGSVSIAGLLAGHNVFYNEFNTGICNLLKYIISGKKLPNKWITREEFEKHKNNNDWYGGLIKCCWSFGNNQRNYLFSKNIENIKRDGHYFCINKKQIKGIPNINLENKTGRRLFLNQYATKEFERLINGNEKEYEKYCNILEKKYTKDTVLIFMDWLHKTGITANEINNICNTQMGIHYISNKSQPAMPTIEYWNKIKTNSKIKNIPEWIENLFSIDNKYKLYQLQQLERLEQLERLQQLESLQQLQQLERLARLERLKIFNLSYEEVETKEKGVIYCDPPYKDTASYQKTIDYEKFYKWCLENENPVFISEYNMPNKFIKVNTFNHRSTLSIKKKIIENLYWNGKYL